jgi:hypothetical protein
MAPWASRAWWWVWFVTLATILAACAMDRLPTRLVPGADGRFQFVAYADAVYPVNSERAEATRRGWLETTLKQNRFCLDGYRIVDRNAVLRQRGLLGDMYDIFYTVECTTTQQGPLEKRWLRNVRTRHLRAA